MKSIDILAPYTQKTIETIELDSHHQVQQKLSRAQQLLQSQSKNLNAFERKNILKNILLLLQDNIEEMAKIAAEEGGKPLVDSKIEMVRAINGVEIAIEQISQIKGEEVPMGLNPASLGKIAFTRKESVGLSTAFSAFNHPLNLAIHQTIPAIAVGAPMLFRPSLSTPRSALKLMQIFRQAGLDEAWCDITLCDHKTAQLMLTHPQLAYFSFIGSAKVGWQLRQQLAAGAKCAMEHGGAAPIIIDENVDLDQILPNLTKAAFYHAGQVCVSVQRIYIHEANAKNFAQAMAQQAKKLKVGNPLDINTEVGPLISPQEVERVDSWVQQAIKEGAQCLCGGEKLSETCYAPTVLLNPDENSLVSRQEIFGPVVCIYAIKGIDEAIARANALPYCFQAAIYTKNINLALNSVRQIKATAVMINEHTAFRVDWMPFGGKGLSGIGVGGIPYTMKEMLCDKLVVINTQ